MISRRRKVLAICGGLTISVGLLAVANPSFVIGIPVISSLVSATDTLDVKWVIVVSSIVLGVSLVHVIGRGPEATVSGDPTPTDRFDQLARTPQAPDTIRQTSIDTIDRDLSLAVAKDEDALESVCERLREVAIATLVREGSNSRRDAEQIIENGNWTTDSLAAAFLDTSSNPEQDLLSRLRHWIDPAEERRRLIRRTIIAIKRMHAYPTDSARHDSDIEETRENLNEGFPDGIGGTRFL